MKRLKIKPRQPRILLSVRIPYDMYAELVKQAKASNTTKTAVVEACIKKCLFDIIRIRKS